MLAVECIDTTDKRQVRRFLDLPYRLYANTPQWVPLIRVDNETQLNKQKHPFFQHSDGDFWVAVRDGKVVGRIAALENKRFNDYHQSKVAQFYFFESEDDQEIADALFEQAANWARQRGLTSLVGPKGLGPLDGYGILVEGFEHRQMMTMMNYNPAYYPRLLENMGFVKEVDFVSCYFDIQKFQLPERVHSIAERTRQRNNLRVLNFDSKAELKAWVPQIGKAYNEAFVNNWEYYPLTEDEIKFVVDNIITVADPRLIKIIAHEDEVAGFLFGFPDISPAIQRSGGRLLPFGIIDMLLEMRRTDWISLNGAGILQKYQGRGGNALLYAEMLDTVRNANFKFRHGEMTQVAETAGTMRADLVNLGGIPYKNHRIYHKEL